MDKISIQELTDIIASQTGQTKKFSEQFLRELVSVISEYLLKDGIVKVKGLGTFKVINVEERKSVDVTTGREIVLPAHSKVQFTPEDSVKQVINEPYSHLQTTILDNPLEPAKPEKPAKPSEPVKPAEPVKPVEPVKPSEPIKPAKPAEPEQPAEPVKPEEPEPSQDSDKGSNSIWWWIGGFLLLDVLLLLYFTMPSWKPALSGMFTSNGGGEQQESVEAVETISEEEQLAKEQAYADSLLAMADSMLMQYQDSISNAIADEYATESASEAEPEKPAASVTPAAPVKPAAQAKFDLDSYDYKMAMNAPVREVVTVIDGSRLTMVAYRAYGDKIFWVYVYDANRDVLRRPSGIAKGMSLKIADLPAELVDPKSEAALAKARELAEKYSK